ncbi:protein of unknown function [Thauera humireducens]|nr:protein of unknown function [Thauera humireducens]
MFQQLVDRAQQVGRRAEGELVADHVVLDEQGLQHGVSAKWRVMCLLSCVGRSFGGSLHPRLAFGAGFLAAEFTVATDGAEAPAAARDRLAAEHDADGHRCDDEPDDAEGDQKCVHGFPALFRLFRRRCLRGGLTITRKGSFWPCLREGLFGAFALRGAGRRRARCLTVRAG